jgi:hypothetical protein
MQAAVVQGDLCPHPLRVTTALQQEKLEVQDLGVSKQDLWMQGLVEDSGNNCKTVLVKLER